MKKILISLILLSSLSFTKVFEFLQTNFKANLIENSIINNKKKIKEYEISYSKDKLDLNVLSPKINKGEIYTFTKDSKYLYSPKLNQKVKQSLSNQDESLYSILSDLSKLEKNINHSIKDKKYIFKAGKLYSIIAKDYKIKIKEYIDGKPTKIEFLSSNAIIEYLIKYK